MIKKRKFRTLVASKYTLKVFYAHLFILCQIIYFSPLSYAKEDAQDALNSPVGSTLARIGLGVATDGDSSVVDINPALLAVIQKQYSVFGSTNFHTGLDMFEIGVLDSLFSKVAGLLKYRQTTKSTSDIDRFFRLGLAQKIPDTHLSLGVSATFIQHHLNNWIKSETSGGSVGVGAFYSLEFERTSPVFLGFSVLNIFDRYQKTSYNLGVAKGFVQNLVMMHIDGALQDSLKHPKIASGLDIKFRDFFYLRGSLGWDFEDKVLPVGGGLFFDGPRLKAYYSLATYQVNTKGIWHSIGLIISF